LCTNSQYKYYLLTPWSRVLLEKLTGSAASQENLHTLWNPNNINMQFLNIHHLLYRTVRHLLPVMLLEVNLAYLNFHFAPYEENVFELTNEL